MPYSIVVYIIDPLALTWEPMDYDPGQTYPPPVYIPLDEGILRRPGVAEDFWILNCILTNTIILCNGYAENISDFFSKMSIFQVWK